MNPSSPREFIAELSIQTGLPQDLLKDLSEFYWKDVYAAVISLEHLHVLVPNLGTFSVKGDIMIDKQLSKLLPIYNALSRRPPTTPIRKARYFKLKEKVEKLQALKQKFLSDQKKKKENKVLRNEIRAKKDLEKQGSHT